MIIKTPSLGGVLIPSGYYSDDIQITVPNAPTPPSLSSQTPGTATASDIVKGKTAWVNGVKLTGTYNGGDLVPSGTTLELVERKVVKTYDKLINGSIAVPNDRYSYTFGNNIDSLNGVYNFAIDFELTDRVSGRTWYANKVYVSDVKPYDSGNNRTITVNLLASDNTLHTMKLLIYLGSRSGFNMLSKYLSIVYNSTSAGFFNTVDSQLIIGVYRVRDVY